MVRVLHLHDRLWDYQTQTGVEQLTRDGSGASRSVGHGGDYATILMGLLKLRKESRDFDLIHAWGEQSLLLAALAGRRKIIFSPTRHPLQHDLRLLRATMSARDVEVVCSSDTMRRVHVERGVPIPKCHLIRPGVDFAKVSRKRDDALRENLTFAPSDHVILAPTECLPGTNHELLILTMTVLNVYDPKYKLLMWGRGPIYARDRRYSRCMLPAHFIAFANEILGPDVPFERLLQAADGAMMTATRAVPTLSIATCMAAALPIVSLVTRTVSELLEDRHNAILVGQAKSRILSRKLIDLEEDKQLAWKLTDTARTEAFEYFSMTRFLQQYRALYEQTLAGKTVEIPQQAPGAGIRFLGRA